MNINLRRPKTILPVPTPSPQFQHVQAGVPDTQLTREAAGLLREFSTPLLINHSHRVFFWANEMGRQTGQKFDVELLFICAALKAIVRARCVSSSSNMACPTPVFRPLGTRYRFTPHPALPRTSLWKW